MRERSLPRECRHSPRGTAPRIAERTQPPQDDWDGPYARSLMNRRATRRFVVSNPSVKPS